MLRKRWRPWLAWVGGCAILVGVGVALYATLPPEPRFVLRGEKHQQIVGVTLSADGNVLVTRAYECAADQVITDWGQLKSWDTRTGAERGVFFQGLNSAFELRGRDDLDERDYRIDQLAYSTDRRYCALVHRGGLALADLHSGREWPQVVASTIGDYDCPESVAVYRLLRREISSKPPGDEIKIRAAIEHLSKVCGGGLKVVIDHEALAESAGNNPDPLEEEVSTEIFSKSARANIARALGPFSIKP